MMKSFNSSPSTPTSSSELYWSQLSDEELRRVIWESADPAALPNVRSEMPREMRRFRIESEYHLGPAARQVRCLHCPQHMWHRHGYVLVDDDGDRYLIGSYCGPKAYGADFLVASRDRRQAKRRAEALERLDRVSERAPASIEQLMDLRRGGAHTFIGRVRAEMEARCPAVLEHLRRLRPDATTGRLELRVLRRRRDVAAETTRRTRYLEEVIRLADLPLSNKEHGRRLTELKARYTPDDSIWLENDEYLGPLRGAEWLLSPPHPPEELNKITLRLRAVAAAGRNTAARTTAQLEVEVRAGEAMLSGAERLREVYADLPAFFEAANLKALVEWYGDDEVRPGRMSIETGQLRIHSRDGVVGLVPPRSSGS